MKEIRFDVVDQVEDDKQIDFMYYYRLIMGNLWKVILFSLIIGAVAIFYALSLPPIYIAKTTLMIEGKQPNIVSFQDVYQVDTRGQTYFKTQLQILKSRSLAEKVVERMQLDKHPLFSLKPQTATRGDINFQALLQIIGLATEEDPKESPAINDDVIQAKMKKALVDSVMESLVIFPVHGTKLVTIQFFAKDPQLAADVANTFAEVYIESHLEAKLEVTQKATNWLSERLVKLRYRLQESEKKLQAFREQEQLVDTGETRSIDVAELEQLTQGVVVAAQQKNKARGLYQQVSQPGLAFDKLLAVPVVANNAIVQGLIKSKVEANRIVAELSKRYGEKHPKMIAAVSNVEQTNGELFVQVDNIISGLESDYLRAKRLELELKNQVVTVKTRLQQSNRKAFSLRDLEREVEANRQVYEVFLNRGKETTETANLKTVNARVVDKALPADYPSKPEKKKIVMVAILFSGMLAIGVILLLDLLDNTIKVPEDVEEKLQAPLLGTLPLDKKNKQEQPFLGCLDKDHWHFAEAARTIRTGFILSGLERPAKVTAITSSVPNEGKSTVSLSLAHALGQTEKVLLIDADMRKPSIGKALNIPLATPGLSNLIAGTAQLEECVTKLPEFGVDVISAGVVLGNPLDLLTGDGFAFMLADLKNRYERIIIDSAPVQAVSDALIIAAHADALIYVVKADATTVPVIKRGLRRLSGVHTRFSGIVLNQIDIDKVKKRSQSYADYYDYYGYGNPQGDATEVVKNSA